VATELEEVRIDTASLALGMYVSRLDRPWEGTPFPLQGFEVRSERELRVLRELCRFVYVDRRREVDPRQRQLLTLMRGERVDERFLGGATYANQVAVEDEMPRARDALRATSALLDQIYAEVASGHALSVEQVAKVVRPLVASVLRSADAFLFLEGMRRHDDYLYGHAIACGALAAAFGRHLGLAESTILSLATAGLLMDIGKTRLPAELLRRAAPLSPADVALVRSHVAHGVDIVTASGVADPDVLDVVRTHHERFDGSGYPDRLFDETIPMAGRMLAIIDSYDAMCSARPYQTAVSRHEALQKIYRARGALYQAELVEQFQVCLGVYPTGSRVELSTGEIAVVLEQNQVRRLRPTVLVISTEDKQALEDFRVFNLLDQTVGGDTVEIVHSLPVDLYPIDTAGYLAGL
jgi:HD-GYP domain-containing protein (c-di-GMP phosphodiesterase class II)